jgi:hypothetical protein
MWRSAACGAGADHARTEEAKAADATEAVKKARLEIDGLRNSASIIGASAMNRAALQEPFSVRVLMASA